MFVMAILRSHKTYMVFAASLLVWVAVLCFRFFCLGLLCPCPSFLLLFGHFLSYMMAYTIS